MAVLSADDRKEKMRRYNKHRHNLLIASGLCVKCKKPRDGNSTWRCKACLRKLADYAQHKAAQAKAKKVADDQS